jgi:hypothetical protein
VTRDRAARLCGDRPRETQMSVQRFVRPMLIAAALLAIAACSSSSTPAVSNGALETGTWGGDSAGMIVGDTAMHLHIACTFGDVSGRVAVDADGRFDVGGSYLLRAYPIAVGPMLPARFVGRVQGNTAVVTVTVNDTVQHATVVRGPVSVTLGKAPREMPCPICKRDAGSKPRFPHLGWWLHH